MKRSTPLTEDARKRQRISIPAAIKTVTVQREWRGGSQQLIRWEHTGDPGQLYVELMKAGQFIQILNVAAAAAGQCSIEVPRALTPAADYYIRLSAETNDSVSACSEHISVDDEHRERCIRVALLLLGLPHPLKLPYPVLRKVAMAAATE